MAKSKKFLRTKGGWAVFNDLPEGQIFFATLSGRGATAFTKQSSSGKHLPAEGETTNLGLLPFQATEMVAIKKGLV